MNRRDFIKSAGVAAALPAITLTCKYEDDEKGPEKNLAQTGIIESIAMSDSRENGFSVKMLEEVLLTRENI